MTNETTGTAERSAPGESKFEKATEAMKGLMDSKSQDPSDEGTQEEKETETKETSKETEPKERENWKDRYKHVQSYADKMATKAEQMASTLVSKDPEAIHEIAKADIELADKIVAKELSKEFGIKTYDELVERLKQSEAKKETKSDESDTEKRLRALEEEKQKSEEAAAKAYLESFKESHPDFSGELEQKVWELFDNSNLTLEQAYKYTRLEMSESKKESEIEEKVYSKVAAQKVASSIASSGSKTSSGKSPKQMSSGEKNFLEGIGAKKTLTKLSN